MAIPTEVNAGVNGGSSDAPLSLASSAENRTAWGAGMLIAGGVLISAGALTAGLRRGRHTA
ncbi:MAG TPA: hypothetical protein VEK80_04610 [Kribbellaceae bacterium]|nr:hypothetical protein [Kribbellaceae bacterium]